MPPILPRLIERKRDGGALTPDEWRWIIEGYVREDIPDYQVSALAMAVVFRGLEPEELTALTQAMLESGTRLDFGAYPGGAREKREVRPDAMEFLRWILSEEPRLSLGAGR